MPNAIQRAQLLLNLISELASLRFQIRPQPNNQQMQSRIKDIEQQIRNVQQENPHIYIQKKLTKLYNFSNVLGLPVCVTLTRNHHERCCSIRYHYSFIWYIDIDTTSFSSFPTVEGRTDFEYFCSKNMIKRIQQKNKGKKDDID